MNFFCSFDRFAWLCKALPLTHISQLTKSKRILWARCVTQKKTQTLNNHLHNLRIQTNLCVEYEALPSRIKQQCRAHNHLNEWMHSAKVALHLQRGQFSNEISGTEIGWCTIALLQYYFVSIRIVFFLDFCSIRFYSCPKWMRKSSRWDRNRIFNRSKEIFAILEWLDWWDIYGIFCI